MKIWVDGDACPVVIKEILYKAANRTETQLTLVANRHLKIPSSPHISFLLVPSGLDVADNEIVKRLSVCDLVITSDIPLAADTVEKGAVALNPRGELYTTENIQERIATRDFMDSLRSSGIDTGGPSSFNKKDRQAFANKLDQILSKQK